MTVLDHHPDRVVSPCPGPCNKSPLNALALSNPSDDIWSRASIKSWHEAQDPIRRIALLKTYVCALFRSRPGHEHLGAMAACGIYAAIARAVGVSHGDADPRSLDGTNGLTATAA